MNKPSSWSSREESLLLLNAYLDNELDAASVLDIEHRLATDAALKAEYDRLLQLQAVLKDNLISHRGSEDFRHRIAAIGEPAQAVIVPYVGRSPRARLWLQMAAAAALAGVVAAGGTYGMLTQNSAANEIAAIVSGHQRSLLAPAPYDVASSDRHTVKPWFDSKLALSPQVVDLASFGFPLAGGRVEVIDGKPLPVLVYQRRAHIIDVIAIPRAGQESAGPAKRTTKGGYLVIQWPGRDFEYSVVSDLAETELDEFVKKWRRAALDR